MAKRESEAGGTAKGVKKAKKAPAKAPENVLRDPIERQPIHSGDRTFKVAYWNMGGIRSSLKKRPEIYETLLKAADSPEVIFLAEHKLQPDDVPGVEKELFALWPGYRAIWNCSARKGYSGVVALIKEDVLGPLKPASIKNKTIEVSTPESHLDTYEIKSVHRGLGIPPVQSEYNTEGRVLTLNLAKPDMYVVVSYVPNSGAGLKRIDYRINEWEKDMRGYLTELAKEKPVAYVGDMNVAHLDLDIWNAGAKHLEKNAGTTTIERNAFGQMLSECDYVDGFRHFHPEAAGHFTFWSVRSRNKPSNRGLRLDYTLVSRSMVDGSAGAQLADAYILGEVCASFGDHCAVGMTVKY